MSVGDLDPKILPY